METIRQAIWGGKKTEQDDTNSTTPTHQQEPVSGVLGNVNKGEPFDAGNMTPKAEQPASDVRSELPSTNTGDIGDVNKSEPFDSGNMTPKAEQPASDMHSELPSTNTGDIGNVNKSEPFDSGNMTPKTEQPTSDMHSEPPSTNPGLMGNNERSTAGQTNPTDTPSMSSESMSKKEEPEKHEEKPEDLDISPKDVSGPGPRPIDAIAKEHGGHMPEHETPMTRGISVSSNSSSRSDASSISSPDEEPLEAKKETGSTTSHEYEEGTHPGTDNYISTGMKSQGGNFDVTKPGAGKEAQRLMHQGALQHLGDEQRKQKKLPHLPLPKKEHNSGSPHGLGSSSPNNTNKISPTSSANYNGDGKVKLSEKLKNKLHIRSH